jgi:hypothetical protein
MDLEKIDVEPGFELEVRQKHHEGRGKELLDEVYAELGGNDKSPILGRLKIDFKVGRHLFVYDDAYHFNRYRLQTLKSDVYSVFNFQWKTQYVRLCRSHERECLLSGLQERIWEGPPLAGQCFGRSEEPGDLSGNGSSGWKLNAYNDVQYDLISRLQGYRIIRIPAYENLMIGGSLKKIDQLLRSPNEATLKAIAAWLLRKTAQ